MVSVLSTGASIVLYDGCPSYPSSVALWDIIDRHGYVLRGGCMRETLHVSCVRAVAASVSLFGTSAKYLQMLEASGAKPRTCNTRSLVPHP